MIAQAQSRKPDRRQDVQDAFLKLPRKTKLVLLLCCHERLTIVETSQATGLPASEVLELYRQGLIYIKHMVESAPEGGPADDS